MFGRREIYTGDLGRSRGGRSCAAEQRPFPHRITAREHRLKPDVVVALQVGDQGPFSRRACCSATTSVDGILKEVDCAVRSAGIDATNRPTSEAGGYQAA